MNQDSEPLINKNKSEDEDITDTKTNQMPYNDKTHLENDSISNMMQDTDENQNMDLIDLNNTNDNTNGPNTANIQNDIPPQKNIEDFINKEMRNSLLEMGFSKNVAEKALFLNQSSSVENAMGWIEEHQTDADFEEELVITGIEEDPKKPKRTKEEIEAAAKELTKMQHEN